MEFKSVNKLLQKSFQENWDLPALSNYQGVTLFYRDVARRIAKLSYYSVYDAICNLLFYGKRY